MSSSLFHRQGNRGLDRGGDVAAQVVGARAGRAALSSLSAESVLVATAPHTLSTCKGALKTRCGRGDLIMDTEGALKPIPVSEHRSKSAGQVH